MVKLWIVLPDLHYPYHDPSFINLISKLIKLLKPNGGVIQLGDFCDFFQLSDYDKNPDRLNTITEDLALYSSQLDEWERLMLPGTEFRQLEGNHEDRLRRYTWRKAPDIRGLIKPIPDMLRFNERNKHGKVKFKWYEIADWKACKIGDTILHHGHFFNRHVAVNNLDRYPSKLITGHTHRVQFASNGDRWSASLGHGSDEGQTAHTPVPQNWQQAFGLLSMNGNVGHLEIVLVENGKCVVRGISL